MKKKILILMLGVTLGIGVLSLTVKGNYYGEEKEPSVVHSQGKEHSQMIS